MPTITFRNGPKKTANDMMQFWKNAHPQYGIQGIKIDKGNITITYTDETEPQKEDDENGKIQNSDNPSLGD